MDETCKANAPPAEVNSDLVMNSLRFMFAVIAGVLSFCIVVVVADSSSESAKKSPLLSQVLVTIVSAVPDEVHEVLQIRGCQA